MSFGRRTATVTPPGRPTAIGAGAGAPPRTRRGGYWLALLGVLITFLVLMPTLGAVSGSSLSGIASALPVAALNLLAVAAIVLLVLDLLLRWIGWRNPWVYAAACGSALFAVCLITRASPFYLVPMALIPGGVGGWILGWSRR